ncbi:hypothetical protein AAFF_G00060360 [Aldrovandia affinis]|uniref:Uncharacterized protein n=1 Tax=Aldrovandia affinis TaxID=143900 RepID=A0AAD7S083_9TELE|nr:hypothetical protein AAFF_G00060360 [Aldrovandia affinis]
MSCLTVDGILSWKAACVFTKHQGKTVCRAGNDPNKRPGEKNVSISWAGAATEGQTRPRMTVGVSVYSALPPSRQATPPPAPRSAKRRAYSPRLPGEERRGDEALLCHRTLFRVHDDKQDTFRRPTPNERRLNAERLRAARPERRQRHTGGPTAEEGEPSVLSQPYGGMTFPTRSGQLASRGRLCRSALTNPGTWSPPYPSRYKPISQLRPQLRTYSGPGIVWWGGPGSTARGQRAAMERPTSVSRKEESGADTPPEAFARSEAVQGLLSSGVLETDSSLGST